MNDLTHVDERGRARMVDVSAKDETVRTARARATVHTRPDVIDRIRSGSVAKGPVLETARIAGIQAAKKTWDLIPLCHPLPLSSVVVDFEVADDRITVEATARTVARIVADKKIDGVSGHEHHRTARKRAARTAQRRREGAGIRAGRYLAGECEGHRGQS